MATVAVLLHDGFYGCGTGAGVSNRRFLEVLAPRLAPGCRLVVMPVRVAEDSNEYDTRWHHAMRRLVEGFDGTVVPLDNGADGRFRFGSMANWRRLAASAEQHLRLVGLDRRTLVIAFDVPFLELPGRLRRTDARVVFVPRGSLALHHSGQAELEWERECYRRMAAYGTRVGLISAFMGSHLASVCRVPPAIMVRVYDGVTRSEWMDQAPSVPLPPAALAGFMLAMGRAHPYKGFDDLLNALVLVRGTPGVPHMVLAAVTEDDEPSAYQRHLRSHVTTDQLDVTVITRFSWGARGLIGHPALRAVVVPSRVEPFGRIPMEVFSHPRTSDVAVVAASAGGLAEVVIEGWTGFTFPPASPAALASAILRGLQSSPQERGQLRAAGRRLVAVRYDYETKVGKFLRAVAPIEATQ